MCGGQTDPGLTRKHSVVLIVLGQIQGADGGLQEAGALIEQIGLAYFPAWKKDM